MNDPAAILPRVLADYQLPLYSDHGVIHWARVLENGLRIADATGADRDVVTLFALLHDSRRVNESTDHGHGARAAEFARALRGDLIHLDDDRFELLYEACYTHTDGLTAGDPTLQACWDADRLDLGRVGITPHPKRLCTDAARALLPWAHDRATRFITPTAVLKSWGLKLDT